MHGVSTGLERSCHPAPVCDGEPDLQPNLMSWQGDSACRNYSRKESPPKTEFLVVKAFQHYPSSALVLAKRTTGERQPTLEMTMLGYVSEQTGHACSKAVKRVTPYVCCTAIFHLPCSATT